MKWVEQEGKTLEEAIEKALQILQVSRDKVNIEILDEGNKGLFRLGSKMARVKVQLKEDIKGNSREIVSQILKGMGLEGEIIDKTSGEGQNLSFEIISDKKGLLIGKRGQTLEALQFLVNRVLNRGRKREDYVRVEIDADGYRERRRRSLTALARRLAEKAKLSGKEIMIEPMSPQDRRIIHLTLKDDQRVKTFSRGEGTFKKVVISAVKEEKDSGKSIPPEV